MSSTPRGRIVLLVAVALLVTHAAPSGAKAHGGVTIGPYEIEVAWRTEPAVVGEPNAVQVSITDDNLQPLTDLEAGGLSVTVTPVGQEGSTLAFSGTGVAGTYEAVFVPAIAANYTFHVTGAIHGTAVDFSVENFVDPPAVQPGPAIDPLVILGGGAVLILLAGMAFLLFRVRPASSPPSG